MRRATAAAALAIVFGTGSTAFAQDPGIGLTMGYPAAIGLIIHLGDRMAVRPEFTFAQTSIDTDVAITGATVTSSSSSDNWSYGVGASALFYLGPKDNLRTYVSPRFT